MNNTITGFVNQVSGENKICNKFDESIAKINSILTLIDNLKVELNKGSGPIVQTHIASLSAIYSEFSNIAKAIEEKKESILTNAQNCESVYRYYISQLNKNSFKVKLEDERNTTWTLRSLNINDNGEIVLHYEGQVEHSWIEQLLLPSAGEFGTVYKTISGEKMVNKIIEQNTSSLGGGGGHHGF